MRLNDPTDRPPCKVRCLRCATWRSLSDVQADLDGPPFAAYFCDPGCLPHDTTDATFVYMARGWQNVGGTWVRSTC